MEEQSKIFLEDLDWYVKEPKEDINPIAYFGKKNRGYMYRRVFYNEREKAFADQWEKECRPIRGINFGQGILQDLFFEQRGPFNNVKAVLWITYRDRYVVATIVQWLGSNCGMSFLHESLKRFGYKITKIEDRGNG